MGFGGFNFIFISSCHSIIRLLYSKDGSYYDQSLNFIVFELR